MIAVKYGITMNCFETDIKIEYSNIFFAVQSFVGVEIGSFYATYVDNRYDRGCLLGVGVYIEIECTAFACFGLSLNADKNTWALQRLNLIVGKKNMLHQIDV